MTLATSNPRGGEYALVERIAAAIDESLKQLPPDEREMIAAVLKSYPPDEQLAALDSLIQLTWRQNPVPVREFLLSKDYLGLVDRSGKPQVYDILIDDLEELFSGQYNEGILTGGIGWGKSMFARLCLARMAYELGCLTNPARAFGLADGSSIVLLNLAINKNNASEIVFKQVVGMLDRSLWFKRFMPRIKDKQEHVEFENGVWLAPFAASEKAVVGFDGFGGVIDEVNEMSYMYESTRKHRGELVFDQAKTLRDAILRRMESRFASIGAKLPGVLVQMSSAKYPDDYTERRIKEARANNDKTVFIRSYPTWGTNPNKHSKVYFPLALGTLKSGPRVIETPEDEKKALEAGAEIMMVPDNLKTHFKNDIHSAIRDFGGRSTAALTPFISRVDKIFEAFQRGKSANLQHPFRVDEGRSFDDPARMATTLLDGKFDIEILKKRLDPTKRYFFHGDLAKNANNQGDKAGLGLTHIAGKKLVVRATADGKEVRQYMPHFVVDMIVNVVAPPEDEIRISTIKGFVLELAQAGFQFASISFDGWQSLSIIQDLGDANAGAVVEEISVDRYPEFHQEVKDALLEDRIDVYENFVLQREWSTLERNAQTGKIDHPVGGSKDLADAIAGCVAAMMKQKEIEQAVMTTSHAASTGNPALDAVLQLREQRARLQGVAPESVRTDWDDILFAEGLQDD